MSWGILGKIGHGIVNGIDNGAYNALGGGLLGDVLQPQQPQPPQQGGGVMGMPPQQGQDPAPQQPAPQQQPFQPTPEQRRQLRGQYLASIGAALSQAGAGQPLNIAGAMQQYQQNAVGQIQAGQQAHMAQQKQQALAAFQQEMQAAGGDPARQNQVLLKYSTVLGPAETKAYADVFKGMKPESDDVVGAPFAGVGPDGQPVMLQHTKTGKVIPLPGYTPQGAFTTDGQGNIYDSHTGKIIHETQKPPKEVQYEYLNGANGYIKVPKTGDESPVPVMVNGKPVLPPRAAANHTTVQLAAPSADGSPNPYVQAIANFEIPLPPPRGGSPAALGLYKQTIAEVKKLNPHWDSMTQPVAQKTLNDFSNGKEATSVNAINTAAGHLGVLAQAAKALDSGDITALNRISNAFGMATGSDKLSVYKTIVHRLAPEITKAYVGAGGGEGDRAGAESDFDPSLGTNRILANLAVSSKLFQSKINALGHQFEKAVPGRKFEGYITPEAQGVFDALKPQQQQQAANPKSQYVAGHRYGGLTFKGGDPNNAANWSR